MAAGTAVGMPAVPAAAASRYPASLNPAGRGQPRGTL